MARPHDIAKTLSKTMRGHIKRGPGRGLDLAPRQTHEALDRRGLIDGYHRYVRDQIDIELTPLGLCVRVVLQGYDPENLSDDERIALARSHPHPFHAIMVGPAEWQPCDKHKGHGLVTRWNWPLSDDGDHAITSADGEIIATCPECDDEHDEHEEAAR